MNAGKNIRLALDACGGDFGPEVTIAAACDAIAQRENLEVIIALPEVELAGQLASLTENQRTRISFEPANVVLESDVGPIAAIRSGGDSTMGRAIELLAQGQADACVSAGSTTALMALGMRTLGMLRGIKRPALMSRIPSASGFTNLLDLGANLHVEATQLVQFAIMGVVARDAQGQLDSSVGLLNVGHEDNKGHSIVRDAHERLKQLPLNYQGFIEGNDIFTGRVDVAVCDGFAGNLILKSGEGLAGMLFSEIRKGFNSSWRSKLGAALAAPALRDTLARFNPSTHNGAPLLGLNGVLVKSHGSANRSATTQAIFEACDEASRHVPGRIQELIAEYEAEKES